MRRKIPILFSLTVLSLILILSLGSCKPSHTHSFKSEWSYDEAHHWHAASCEHTEEVADKSQHSFGEGVTTTEPTETSAGVKTLSCSVCGYSKTEVIPPLSTPTHTHIYSEKAVPSTCGEKGYTLYSCECGVTYKDNFLEKTEHIVTEWTANNDGTHSGTCTLGHSVKASCSLSESATEPSCEEQGYTTYTCSLCGYSFKENFVEAEGHKFADTYLFNDSYHWKEAICTHTNEKTAYEQHQFTTAVTQPNCTEKGYTTYSCQCGYSYVADYVDALGHTVAEWTLTGSIPLEATRCEYADSFSGVCSTCDKPQTKTETVEKHDYYWAVTDPATCSHDGTKAYICSNESCKHHSVSATTKTESYRDAENHVWTLDTENTSESVTSYKCSEQNCLSTKKTVHATDTSVKVGATDFENANEINLPDATIGFDAEVKSALAGSGQINVSAEALSGDKRNEAIADANLSTEQKQKLLGKEIYSFTLSTDSTPGINNLVGFATIRIPYTLALGENPDNLVIWYISGDVLEMISATYSTDADGQGYVSFSTNHFSDYAISELTPAERCLKDGHVTATFGATCYESGHTVCTRCSAVTEVIPATGHSWHSEISVTAECTANGEVTFECLSCKESFVQIIPAKGHYYVLENHKAASCTEAGVSVYGCIYCTDSYSVSTPVRNHTFNINVVAPTCTELGYTEKSCTVCGLSNNVDYIQPLGHRFSEGWSSAEEGHFHVCVVCGSRDSIYSHTPGAAATEQSAEICTACEYVITPPLAHVHTLKKTEAITPDCLNGGNIEYYVCSCGKWFADEAAQKLIIDHSSVFVDALGHSLTSVKAVDPSCTEPGYTSGVMCTVCNVYIRGHIEISPLGHSYSIAVTAPDCTNGGYTEYTCHCGDSYVSNHTEPLGHTTVSTVTAATCEAGGYVTEKCLNCDYENIHSRTEALGHSLSEEYFSDEEAHFYRCERCSYTEGREKHLPDFEEATESHGIKCTVCEYEIAKPLNHTHSPAKSSGAIEASCTAPGSLAYYTCSCGLYFLDEGCTEPLEKLSDAIIKPVGHASKEFEETPPSCKSEGLTAGTLCERCGEILSGGEVIPATDHSYEDGFCTMCGEKKLENLITVIVEERDGKYIITVSVSKANFAAVNMTLRLGKGVKYDLVEAIEGAAVNSESEYIKLVWFSDKYENITEDTLLLSVELDGDADAQLYVEEMYTVLENNGFCDSNYEIIYN